MILKIKHVEIMLLFSLRYKLEQALIDILNVLYVKLYKKTYSIMWNIHKNMINKLFKCITIKTNCQRKTVSSNFQMACWSGSLKVSKRLYS